MKRILIIALLSLSLLLTACSYLSHFSPSVETTAAALNTTAAVTIIPTTAPTTVQTATQAPTTQTASAEPTTITATITTTGATAPVISGANTLTGTFQGYEWGDYLHVSILGDDGTTYDFFVLKYPGVEVETLDIGQKVKVIWQNSDEYLDPPGDNVNLDKVLSIELIG
ncbi:MAG: hypothetical protein VB070_07000 [Clostridiaceae bacterium]|nr:hypothetical protein [Clostridiaceae bacterium]